jgi:hypothetical protein
MEEYKEEDQKYEKFRMKRRMGEENKKRKSK